MQDLKKKIYYDPLTGEFTRLATGKKAGYFSGKYLHIKVSNTRFQQHRLAWFFYHGTFPNCAIDHIDGDPSNNRIANLRLATDGINQQNSKKFIGVTVDRNLYKAQISIKGRSRTIGRFRTFEEARQAYLQAKIANHFGCSHWNLDELATV